MEPKNKQLDPKRKSLPSKCDTCGGGFHNGFYGHPTTCDDCIVKAEKKGKN